MALSQFAFERFRGSFAAFGAVYGRGAVHDGWIANTGPQVYPEFMQCLFERVVRGTEARNKDGWHAVRGVTFRNIHEGAEDISGVYVQRLV